MLLLRLVYESFSFAFNSLKANKLRTILSLLGITIGIFAIISVFTVIDSLENYIRKSLNALGDNMAYIQKWPWAPPEGETEYPWWRYLNRPVPRIEEAEEIMRRGRSFQNAVFFYGFNRTIQQAGNKIDNATVIASSYGLFDLWNLKISSGRYFTEAEMSSGANVAVIGAEIASRLFPDQNPLGQVVKVQGFKYRVIGTYLKSGQDMFGTSMDNNIHICLNQSLNLMDIRNQDIGQSICVKSNAGVSQDQFISELEGIMRSIRRLQPQEENNFALNEVSIISNQFDQFFVVFNMAGWIIGGFSILVGGFGIANIMFVSVKERTRIIGIQKSLGAKKSFILLEFIFEAVVLSVIGGIAGLLFIYLGTVFVNSVSDFTISLTLANIIRGILISVVIGFVAGLMPARSAAALNPVVAMNSV